jgi:hypothetical protein
MITDTGLVAEALDLAERVWPDLPRGTSAITRLLQAGVEATAQKEAARQAAIDSLAQFSDDFHPGYLADLRNEWPE